MKYLSMKSIQFIKKSDFQDGTWASTQNTTIHLKNSVTGEEQELTGDYPQQALEMLERWVMTMTPQEKYKWEATICYGSVMNWVSSQYK